MGLIRKSLALSTLGVVKGSSKKQRIAKATMKAAQREASAAESATRLTEQQAAREHEFRYDTDPAYRAWWDKKQAEP
jgi:peptide subunit release factor 1 (eRF1)